MQCFQVTQKNQRHSTQEEMMFETFSSTATINSIKYNPNVWTTLNESNIFMYPDKFDRQDTACPGYLINIHLRNDLAFHKQVEIIINNLY